MANQDNRNVNNDNNVENVNDNNVDNVNNNNVNNGNENQDDNNQNEGELNEQIVRQNIDINPENDNNDLQNEHFDGEQAQEPPQQEQVQDPPQEERPQEPNDNGNNNNNDNIDHDIPIHVINENVNNEIKEVPQEDEDDPVNENDENVNDGNQHDNENPNNENQAQADDQQINDNASVALFTSKLKTFNEMYKTNVDANKIADTISEAWGKLKSEDEQQKQEGKQLLSGLFKDILKPAFDSEKNISYDERRIPEYAEIIKSGNELLRSCMFAYTDLYRTPAGATLFDQTAFGGMELKGMAELTAGESLWDKDQKSDEAWDIQAKMAKDYAKEWQKESKPYSKMVKELTQMVDNHKKGLLDRKEMLNKLAAAEWMLTNNDKFMIKDPDKPDVKIPNWGNYYWDTLAHTRQLLGIDKHISIREMIQADYAEAAKAVTSAVYHETQIKDHVVEPQARAKFDSIDKQKELFVTQSNAINVRVDPNQIEMDNIDLQLQTKDKVQMSVPEQDERQIQKNAVREWNFEMAETKFEINILRGAPENN